MKKWLCLLLLFSPVYAADNISITAVGSTSVAADEVTDATLGSVKTQYIKLMDGTIDSTNKAVVTSGGDLVVVNQAVVSSTAFNTGSTGLAQGTTGPISMTSLGQVLVTGISQNLVLSTANANAAPGLLEQIMIASPTAPTVTYLCGCSFNNSSTTATGFSLYQSSSVPTTNKFFPIGAGSNHQAAGIWSGCMDPFFRSVPGGQITIKADTTNNGNITMNCSYFQGP